MCDEGTVTFCSSCRGERGGASGAVGDEGMIARCFPLERDGPAMSAFEAESEPESELMLITLRGESGWRFGFLSMGFIFFFRSTSSKSS